MNLKEIYMKPGIWLENKTFKESRIQQREEYKILCETCKPKYVKAEREMVKNGMSVMFWIYFVGFIILGICASFQYI